MIPLQIGRIYFNANNSEGCDSEVPFTTDYSDDPDGILTPIFLVERGTCKFVTKVRNVQNQGGSLAIIIDNKKTENPDHVIMSDDGTGTGIMIPSILINYEDGQKLLEFLNDPNIDDETKKKASISAEFV